MLARVLCLYFLATALHSVHGSWSSNRFFTSCTGGTAVLPNLSFGKMVKTGTAPGACQTGVGADQIVRTWVVTWSYYATYPPTCGENPVDECCHSTTTSTLTFYNTVYQDILLVGPTVTFAGNVTAGAFLGSTVSLTVIYLDTNVAGCSSAIGKEARSGTTELTIIGGPTCQGILYEETCPGLHMP